MRLIWVRNLQGDKYDLKLYRKSTVRDLGLLPHHLMWDLGQIENKRKVRNIGIVVGKRLIHIDPGRTGEISMEIMISIGIGMIGIIETIEMIERRQGIGMKETEGIIEIVVIRIIMSVGREEVDQEKDLKTKWSKWSLNRTITIKSWVLTRSQCQSKFQCHQFPGSEESVNVPETHWTTTRETKAIMKVSSGTHFHGCLVSITLRTYLLRLWPILRKCVDWW